MTAEPRKPLRILGMQRSGNHAIIDWLVRNLDGEPIVHLNDVRRAGDPLGEFAALKVGGDFHRRRVVLPDGEAERWVGEALATGALIVSYENMRAADTFGRDLDFTALPGVAAWDTVLVTRSFASWLASFTTMRHGGEHREKSVVNTANFVKACGELLAHADDPRVVHVRYDDWLVDLAYRERILAALGIALRDNTLAEERFIAKSSFGAAPRIDIGELLQRWKRCAEDPLFALFMTLAANDPDTVASVAKVYPADGRLLERIRNGATLGELAAEG